MCGPSHRTGPEAPVLVSDIPSGRGAHSTRGRHSGFLSFALEGQEASQFLILTFPDKCYPSKSHCPG